MKRYGRKQKDFFLKPTTAMIICYTIVGLSLAVLLGFQIVLSTGAEEPTEDSKFIVIESDDTVSHISVPNQTASSYKYEPLEPQYYVDLDNFAKAIYAKAGDDEDKMYEIGYEIINSENAIQIVNDSVVSNSQPSDVAYEVAADILNGQSIQ